MSLKRELNGKELELLAFIDTNGYLRDFYSRCGSGGVRVNYQISMRLIRNGYLELAKKDWSAKSYPNTELYRVSAKGKRALKKHQQSSEQEGGAL